MTAPDSVAVPQPGWWARTGRIGVALTPTFGWASNPVGSFAPVGHGSGGWGFATADTIGHKPAQVKGIQYSATSSVTLPTHAIGDIIVIYAYINGATTAPTPATAGGTVPTWTTIDNPGGANLNASGTFYAVATATNHTSGTWVAAAMSAVVLSGQAASPIGGHAESGSTSTNSVVAPAITLAHADGSSAILHFFATRDAVTTWTPPTGYTTQGTPNATVCCATKDNTTSDGSVTQGFSPTGGSFGYRGATVEIKTY